MTRFGAEEWRFAWVLVAKKTLSGFYSHPTLYTIGHKENLVLLYYFLYEISPQNPCQRDINIKTNAQVHYHK